MPPYSPELNPQEQIWDELREKFFGNKLFKSIKAVINKAVEGLRSLEAMPLTLAHLIPFPVANAIFCSKKALNSKGMN